jgi:hypothetical protein
MAGLNKQMRRWRLWHKSSHSMDRKYIDIVCQELTLRLNVTAMILSSDHLPQIHG